MPYSNRAKPSNNFPFVQPPPQTKEQRLTYVEDFITNDIPQFFDPKEELKNLAEKAVVQAEMVTKKFDLRPELTPGVMKLAFYDFVILCGKLTSYFTIANFHFCISSKR